MPDQDGVEIYKRFYPWPDSFRLGDPVLVKEITGMKWPEFLQAIADQTDANEEAREMGEEPPQADQVVVAGLVAVAFWQGNPHMSRDKVRRALERVKMEDIELVEGDEGEVDIGPPAQGGVAEVAPPTTISNGSEVSLAPSTETTTPGYSSDATNPNGSGLPGSPTTSPESLPA